MNYTRGGIELIFKINNFDQIERREKKREREILID